jgi:hypothetical protein
VEEYYAYVAVVVVGAQEREERSIEFAESELEKNKEVMVLWPYISFGTHM